MRGLSCEQLGAEVTDFVVGVAALPRLSGRESVQPGYIESFVGDEGDVPKFQLSMSRQESLVIGGPPEGFLSPSLDGRLERTRGVGSAVAVTYRVKCGSVCGSHLVCDAMEKSSQKMEVGVDVKRG